MKLSETFENILEFGPESKKNVKKLYHFIVNHYKNEPYYAPPLKMELLGSKLLKTKGLLRNNHPFHAHAKVRYFLALSKNKKILGSIAAVVNEAHNNYYQEKTGFFGFFECVHNQEIAFALLDKAKNWLLNQGMKIMRGPANFSTNEPIGLQINAFDTVPFINTPHNYPYYQNFLENYGFQKSMDLLAQMMPVRDNNKETKGRIDRLKRFSDKIKTRNNITLEDFNIKKPKKHLEIIKELYQEAWKDNWGFVPLSDKEFDILAHNLKTVADPKMVKIAFVNGKPAAFIGSLPDINEVLVKCKKWPEIFKLVRLFWWLIRKKFTRVRLLLFGIKEEYRMMGLDGVLFLEEFLAGGNPRRNYHFCEISWLLETNQLVIKAGENMKAHTYKTWRLFDLPLK